MVGEPRCDCIVPVRQPGGTGQQPVAARQGLGEGTGSQPDHHVAGAILQLVRRRDQDVVLDIGAIDPVHVVEQGNHGSRGVPLEKPPMAGPSIPLIHVLEPEQRVPHEHQVQAAILGGGVWSGAEPFITSVKQRILDRSTVHEVILDTVVADVLEVDVPHGPAHILLRVHARAVSVIENPESLELERGAVGDKPVCVVHPGVRRARRQRADDGAAVETDARTAADVYRNVGRCEEPGGGRIDLGISSQGPAVKPGRLQSAHRNEGVSRCLAQARRDRPLCVQAGDGDRGHRGRHPCGALHFVLRGPRFSVAAIRCKNRSPARCRSPLHETRTHWGPWRPCRSARAAPRRRVAKGVAPMAYGKGA